MQAGGFAVFDRISDGRFVTGVTAVVGGSTSPSPRRWSRRPWRRGIPAVIVLVVSALAASMLTFTPAAATAAAAGATALAPTVTGVSPASGPISGGTVVTVTGTGFTQVQKGSFGSTAGTALTVVSATKL